MNIRIMGTAPEINNTIEKLKEFFDIVDQYGSFELGRVYVTLSDKTDATA